MFSDEKWFSQDGQYNRQNDRIYALSRQASTEDMSTIPEHKFPFKVIVRTGENFSGLTQEFEYEANLNTFEYNCHFTAKKHI